MYGAANAWCLSNHQEARALFEPFLPCDDAQLRKVYLRLALKYHPDKHPKAARGWEEYKGQGSGGAAVTHICHNIVYIYWMDVSEL